MIIDIDELVTETEEAYLIRIGKERTWVPKALSEIMEDPKGREVGIELPSWLAEKEGLI